MNTFLKWPIFLLVLLSMAFTSCQKEDEEFIDLTNEETVTADSIIADLLLRSAQNFGIIDDLIDGNSCATIKFPFTVIANGQTVTLEDEDDFEIIEDIFDQFPNDNDTLEIIFPITLIFEDYSEVMVNNQQELDALIAQCESGGGGESIGCVDFVYPITFFVYDENQQQTATVTVNSDLELYLFLSGLDDDDFISLQFPITVILSDGSTVEVNSNSELQQLIESCDNSGGSDPVDPTEVEQFLTEGVWYVTYFFDDYDETSEFNGYAFTFFSDNTAQATNGNDTVTGTWSVSGGNSPDLALDFGDDDPFDELEEDWDILEASNQIIRLRDESGDGSADYLTFERTPATGGGGATNQFIETITSGDWYVNLLNDDGDNETCDFVEYVFVYNLDGTVVASSASDTVNGFWTVQNDDGELDLIINFTITGNDDPFEELNDDWEIISYNQNEIALADDDGSASDTLIFGRNPASGCGSSGAVQELIDTLSNGQWFVAEYLDDGDDETGDYNGYILEFDAAGTVTATNSSNQINGTWVVILDDGQLELILDFGSDVPFDEFNDDWDVLNFTSVVVELQDISGSGGGTDNLRFEKL